MLWQIEESCGWMWKTRSESGRGLRLDEVAEAAEEAKRGFDVFVFALDCPGLTPALQTDGSISFVNSSGSAVATMPAPVAVDSK